MKFNSRTIGYLVITLMTLGAPQPALAHGGEGWILGVLTGGALTFFGIILVGIIAIGCLALLVIFGYWVYLVHTRKTGSKILLLASMLLAPAIVVVIGLTSFIGSMWYKTLTNGRKQNSVQEKNIEPPAQSPQPEPANNPP